MCVSIDLCFYDIYNKRLRRVVEVRGRIEALGLLAVLQLLLLRAEHVQMRHNLVAETSPPCSCGGRDRDEIGPEVEAIDSGDLEERARHLQNAVRRQPRHRHQRRHTLATTSSKS